MLLKCCTSGEDYAEKQNDCQDFQPPPVQPELMGACLFSAEICCNSKLRIEQCKMGVQAAKTGSDCHNYDNRTGVEFYKNCCESCKIGMILGRMQEECSMGVLYGIPFDDSFNYCCNEMKSSDTFVLAEDESKCKCSLLFANFFSLEQLKYKFRNFIDICTKFENLCSQTCEATVDSYVCKCENGFKLGDDKKTCFKEDSDTSTDKSNEVPINSTEY